MSLYHDGLTTLRGDHAARVLVCARGRLMLTCEFMRLLGDAS
jgi:hypothetical protein